MTRTVHTLRAALQAGDFITTFFCWPPPLFAPDNLKSTRLATYSCSTVVSMRPPSSVPTHITEGADIVPTVLCPQLDSILPFYTQDSFDCKLPISVHP